MKIEFLALCDSATVREGLLHILGTPITRIYRPSLPAPLGVSVAAIFIFEAEDHNQLREFAIEVNSPNQTIQKGVGAVSVGPRPDKAESGENIIYSPFVASLMGVDTPEWGEHSVSISLEGGDHTRSFKFWVLPQEDQILPGGLQISP